MGLLSGVTDAIGLTDYSGAKNAQNRANQALSSQLGISQDLIDWWKTNAAPYQLGLMERGMGLYDDASFSDADYARTLGNVSSDVSKAFSKSRDATRRGLMRYGVSPSSGRFANTMISSGNQQGATEAAMKNAARSGMRDTEFARKAQALGVASGLNSPNYGLAGAGIGGLSSAASQYGNMASNLTASNQSGIGGLLGGIGYAVGGMFADGKEVKSRYADGMEVEVNIGGEGKRERFMGDAERVDMPKRGLMMPQVRGEMRGPGTPISDDIPVQTDSGEEARLADGEVVMPTDTVSKIGLQLIRHNPEKAAHMVGVKMLEEQIEQTHVPAEEQEMNGLSADPRGVEGYACGGEKKGYADGGESSPWKLGLSALGHGLANAYSRGGWLQGVQAGKRANAYDEEAQYQRGQRERAAKEQQRQDKYREDMQQAIADASQYQGGDVMDPEFGIEAQTGDPSMARGLRLAQPDMERAVPVMRGLKAQYDPGGYLSDAAATDAAQANRAWEREKLGLEHANKLALEEKKVKTGSVGKLPSEAALAEWMVRNKVANDAKEAWGKVRAGRYSPEELAMKYATSVMGKPSDYYGDEDYQSAFDATYENAFKQFSKKLDGGKRGGELETDGQRLPSGIPAGAKQIGTSGGKPVYEAPNGKRYIVE